MNTIETALQSITGYLISIVRNTQSGWYELEIGIPKNWVYNENNEIKCDVMDESSTGKLIKISPKKNNIIVDDLVTFVEIIIETNNRIAEKEKEFTDKMQLMKDQLEKEAKKFYVELDEIREKSFTILNDNFVKGLRPDDKVKRKYNKKSITITGTTS